MKRTNGEVSGAEALSRRDALEAYTLRGVPRRLHRLASATITWITGLAPTAHAGRPIIPGSELRAVIYFLLTVAGSLLGLSASAVAVRILGGLALVSAMRNFASGFGHQLTHSTRKLPWPAAWTRTGYDVVSALLWMPSYLAYKTEHGYHHANVGGPDDPDERFLRRIGARLNGFLPFLATLSNPGFHLRFLRARFRAVFVMGPSWRRMVAAAGIFGMMAFSPVKIAILVFFAVFVYQTMALISWLSLHLWGDRPESGNNLMVTTAVTYGRLLIPEASFAGVLHFPLYALVRVLWLQADLNNHDLHHLWKGHWTEAPYVRTQLLLEGVPIRQTIGIRAMFQVAFESRKPQAADTEKEPPTDRQLLSM